MICRGNSLRWRATATEAICETLRQGVWSAITLRAVRNEPISKVTGLLQGPTRTAWSSTKGSLVNSTPVFQTNRLTTDLGIFVGVHVNEITAASQRADETRTTVRSPNQSMSANPRRLATSGIRRGSRIGRTSSAHRPRPEIRLPDQLPVLKTLLVTNRKTHGVNGLRQRGRQRVRDVRAGINPPRFRGIRPRKYVSSYFSPSGFSRAAAHRGTDMYNGLQTQHTMEPLADPLAKSRGWLMRVTRP